MSHTIHTLNLSSENRPVPMTLFVKGTDFPWEQAYDDVQNKQFDPSQYHALWMLNWCKYTLTRPETHYHQLPAAAAIWSAIYASVDNDTRAHLRIILSDMIKRTEHIAEFGNVYLQCLNQVWNEQEDEDLALYQLLYPDVTAHHLGQSFFSARLKTVARLAEIDINLAIQRPQWSQQLRSNYHNDSSLALCALQRHMNVESLQQLEQFQLLYDVKGPQWFNMTPIQPLDTLSTYQISGIQPACYQIYNIVNELERMQQVKPVYPTDHLLDTTELSIT